METVQRDFVPLDLSTSSASHPLILPTAVIIFSAADFCVEDGTTLDMVRPHKSPAINGL